MVKILCYGIIAVIHVLSFRSFSAVSYPDLNSDHAIHILMSADLRLPDDLYYWGQSRLGSLVPILSSVLIKIFSLAPSVAISWVEYIISVIGFLSFASLLRSNGAKVVFALLWFLPPVVFIELVEPAHPYRVQLSLTGLAIVIFLRFFRKPQANLYYKHLLLTAGTAILFLALWVSELSIVNFGFIAIVVAFYLSQLGPRLRQHLTWKKLGLFQKPFYRLNILISSFWGTCFLIYAKVSAYRDELGTVRSLNTVDETIHMIQVVFNSVKSVLTFQVGNWLLSFHTLILGIALLCLTLSLGLKGKRIKESLKHERGWLALFFAWQWFANLVLLALSHWVYLNAAHPRYFTVAYISFCFLLLLLLETLKNKKYLAVCLLMMLASLSASLTLPSYVFSFHQPDSKVQQLQKVESLGQAGLIGDYWHSYLLCSVNPDQLRCTPHDMSAVRCDRCVDQALSAPNLYVVKEGWLDSFPDELRQFDKLLEKRGEPKTIAGYRIAPYQVRNDL